MDEIPSGGAIVGLADDMDCTGLFEHGADSSQEDRVIIGDEHRDSGYGELVVQGGGKAWVRSCDETGIGLR